jgi:exodeoxyribonuclease VII large subunit
MNNKQKTYTIFELNNVIKQILEGSFPNLVWVRGEVSGFDKQKNNKHIYFQLQEKHFDRDEVISVIPAALFNSDLKKIRQKLQETNVGTDLKDGIEVRVLVEVNVYLPSGKYELVIRDIDTTFTLGKLAKTREMIIQYLKSKGLLV